MTTRGLLLAVCLTALALGCGGGDEGGVGDMASGAVDAGEGGGDGADGGQVDGGAGGDASPVDAGQVVDSGMPNIDAAVDSGPVDGGVLDIVIYAKDDCTITTVPASITVPEGTSFTVNWINHPTSDTAVEIAKIDQFNQVPISIDHPPGFSYHDEVREWCGQWFTGTFSFRITSCFEPYYLPVDCGG